MAKWTRGLPRLCTDLARILASPLLIWALCIVYCESYLSDSLYHSLLIKRAFSFLQIHEVNKAIAEN
jgi:hypothetical protein